MTTTQPTPTHTASPRQAQVERAIARRSFCTLATASTTGRPHVAGVLYSPVDGDLYISTMASSRKARNIAENPAVFVAVPVRRLPVGPPSMVQFASTAEVLPPDDPTVRRLAAAGRLKTITGHGELDLPGGCFVRVGPPRVFHTYGIGLPLRRLVADPLHAGGRVERS